MKFAMTYCSQCGAECGPGDAGVSRCSEHQDEPVYRQLADLLYELGWRPDCDAQLTNLRDDLHRVTAIVHPLATTDLRDTVAIAALQGLLAQSQGVANGSDPMHHARWSYSMADAMLKARTA